MQHSNADHEELIEKSKHLLYEIRQFEGKAKILAQFVGKKDVDEYIIHSVFESFLIHSRVIHEFLFESASRPTDIRASDFKEDTQYLIPKPDGSLKYLARYMTDKRLMHLTTDRLEIVREKHKWEINRIYVPLHGQLLMFYEWVPDEHICKGLKGTKDTELLKVRSLAPGESMGTPWGFNLVLDTSGPSLLATSE